MKYLPSQKSEIADGRAVNAFIADSQANVGLVATDNGISCISAAYSIEADGDVLTSLTASWVAKPTKSFLVTNIDQYNDVVLLGTTSNGICSAFLDEVDGDLGDIVTKLNGATKIAGSPNNATSIVETSQSSGKKIFAAASDGKIYS